MIITSKNSTKATEWLLLFFKVILLLALGWLVYQSIAKHHSIEEIYSTFVEQIRSNPNGWVQILVTITLMMANWSLESHKWRIILSTISQIDFSTSLKSVTAGLTFGIFTPGRVGEYGGRLIMLPDSLKPFSIHGQAISSLSQNIINILVGGILSFFFLELSHETPLSIRVVITTISLTVALFLCAIAFNSDKFAPLLGIFYKILPGLKRWMTLSDWDSRLINTIILISLVRYLIFASQYVLLLRFFGVELDFLVLIAGIGTIFLLQSGLPFPAILGVVARAEIALFVWLPFDVNAISVISATFSLWVLNLLIPAIVGAFIINFNFAKK